MMRLTLYFKEKRFTGEYPLPCALARIENARLWSDFVGFVAEVA